MKSIRYVLAVQFIMGVLLCASAFGQPTTEASVTEVTAVAVPYSQSDSHSASGGSYQDTSDNSVIWGGTAQADSTFGFNSASADVSYNYDQTLYGVRTETGWAASASFNLNWSTADNSQSGIIISVQSGLGDSISGQYTGVFSFVYGMPYNIQSLLGVSASYPLAAATASSMWADTITFLGQPDGYAGSATFVVSLSGSITEPQSQSVFQYAGAPATYDQTSVVGDFSGGAVLSSIELPDGSSIEDASGFVYPVPEPGTFSLLGLGLGGLWLRRSKSKTQAAFQTLDSKSRR